MWCRAARLRIRNVFSNGVPVYMSFSAGKDSLCMSHLVYDQIRQGRIDASQLIVVFIDEEALYPSMEAMTMRWRKRFLSVGAQFPLVLPAAETNIRPAPAPEL